MKQANQSGENVSTIQSLTQRVYTLGVSQGHWNDAYIWFVAGTVVLAAMLFITQFLASRRGKQLATAQAELIRLKDAQLAIDLKAKDESIAKAGERASAAEAKAEGFRREIATANERAAEANRKAEEEHLARARIEEKLAGWKLDAEAQTRVINKIKQYGKTPFDLGANPTEVAFMETMDGVLTSAGWSRHIPKSDNAEFSILLNGKARINYVTGVYVGLAQARLKDFGPPAQALIQALKAEGIPAQGQMSANEPDPTAIHIVIGAR